jgi:gamma-glutamyltranspeptidase
LALGAAGGNKIPVAINQVAYRYLKQNLPLGEALFMPRVYMDDSPIFIERHIGLARFNDSEIYLKSKNIEPIEIKGYFGRVHAIALDSLNNRWIGAADKDWEGTVSSYE